MLKGMLLLKRRPGLSLAESIERYETVRVPLAQKHAAGLLRYERHSLDPSPTHLYGNLMGEPEYDVLTELWYADRAAFEKAHGAIQRHPERVAEIIADEEALFDRSLHAPGLAAPRPIDVPLWLSVFGPRGTAGAAEVADGIIGPPHPSLPTAALVSGSVLDPGEDPASDRVRRAVAPGARSSSL